ncbi:MAG: Glycosyltransferase, partial [Bacteroidetes bacterium]|nr:Glycosyltransferase [Bacteroidota bacterium]
LNKVESLEFMSLIVTGAGLIGAGRPIICNGANLAYRKSAFNAVQGFKGTVSSNDDETLMQRIFNRNIGKVRFVADPDAVVRTESKNNLWSFLKQRLRWAAKKGRYEDKTILAELALLYFFFFVLLAAGGASFFVPELKIPVAITFGLKIVLDYAAMRKGAHLLHQKLNGLVFLVAELFHVPYIVFTGAVGQFISQEWKGRSLDR